MACTINNCPVIIEDVRKANNIYSCNFITLKGVTFLRQPKWVQTEYIEVPDSFQERIGNMTVAADVMFLNNIPFVVIFLRGVISQW